ncbi:MAG TPA: glycosyltransferase family 4 protein [Anaeromyxobacteraceae bacterium]|nr:glycosyltransferase family 4 protein [Anaeromyxobacteraceae bacterium]
MPRVLHVMHGLLLGGLERLVVDLAACSRRRGVDAMVVAVGADGRAPAGALLADGRGPVGALLEAEGVPHLAIPARGLSVEAVSGIVGAAHRFGADVLHAHDIGPWIVAVACASLLPGVSAIGTFHTVKAPRGARRFAARVAAELAPVLVACGKEVARDRESWVPARARIETIENGIDVGELPTARQRAEARARMGVPDGAVVIGYLGRLFEEKAPDVLADAFERAFPGRPDVHVAFVGYGPMEEDLRRRAARDPRIHPLGRVMDGRALLAGLDVYAQPSKREGKSLALLEGMAAGLPTVSSRLPAICEVHEHGATALLAEPGDVEGVAAALRRLVDDPALRARLGAAARERVEAHSAHRMMDEYVALYEELVAARRRPAAERLRRMA